MPSTPGQIGLIEAGAVFALVGLGVGPNRSLAFALLYHAAHLLPLTLLGLPPLLRLRWRDRTAALL
ncbi:MAG: lysylphosphatidylglycerol synthase domain-containing protein [Vicinamibacteria bacterium]